MQEVALESAENYERQALDRLRRMGLAAADLELKGPKKLGAHSFLGQGEFVMEETLG
jgi:COP9 signalosome complex subunit 1